MFSPYTVKISLGLIPLAALQQGRLWRGKESQSKVGNYSNFLPALGIQTSLCPKSSLEQKLDPTGQVGSQTESTYMRESKEFLKLIIRQPQQTDL